MVNLSLRRLSLFGHVACLDDCADKSTDNEDPDCTRSKIERGPRITWMKTVPNDLESHNLTLTEAVNTAQNHPLIVLVVQARIDDDDDFCL